MKFCVGMVRNPAIVTPSVSPAVVMARQNSRKLGGAQTSRSTLSYTSYLRMYHGESVGMSGATGKPLNEYYQEDNAYLRNKRVKSINEEKDEVGELEYWQKIEN